MDLQQFVPVTLTTAPSAPSWIEPKLLEVAADLAARNQVRGSMWLARAGQSLEFDAWLRSARTADDAIHLGYGLPELAFGARTQRVHSVSEVLSELAHIARETPRLRWRMVELLGRPDTAILLNAAGRTAAAS